MSTKSVSFLCILLPVAGLMAGPALAAECQNRIANMEKALSAQEEGAGPALTGSLQASGQADSSASAAAAPAPNNRIPANRPASAEAAGAQAGATASTEPTAGTSGQDTTGRLAATRPPAPESQAAQVQNSTEQSQSQGTGRMSDADRTRLMTALSEAKALDSQGREADCLRALPANAGALPAVK